MSRNLSGNKGGKDTGNRQASTGHPSSNTRSNKRGNGSQPAAGQRNPITGEGMDIDDGYTVSGNVYGSGADPGHRPVYQREQYGGRHSHLSHTGRQQHMMGYGPGQVQEQHHLFRTAQASKQMVYEVYGNCVAMLEELENRELKHHGIESLPRSDIHLPSQHKHDDSTIKRKLETQLLLFQSQMDSCDREIKDEVRQELKENTLVWNSQREARKIPNGVTDMYAAKLYEVLEKGKTEHPREFYEQPAIDEAGMRNAMRGIVEGQHKMATLDDDFRQNPDKKAQGPKLRGGAGASKGAERLARENPDLAYAVDKYMTPSLR